MTTYNNQDGSKPLQQNVLFYGCRKSGKSQVISRMMGEEFSDEYVPDNGMKLDIKESGSGRVKYVLREEFHGENNKSMQVDPIIRKANHICLTFDQTNPKALAELKLCLAQLVRVRGKDNLPPITLVATHADKTDEIEVTMQDVRTFMLEAGLLGSGSDCIVVSSTDNQGINDLYQCIENQATSKITDKRAIAEEKIKVLKSKSDDKNLSENGKKALANIIKYLEEGIEADDPKQHYKDNAESMQTELQVLQREWSSIWESVCNAVVTCLAAVGLVDGQTIEDNKEIRGDENKYWAAGDKNAAIAVMNEVIDNVVINARDERPRF
jgi:GTPase SAR1 family protein